LSAAYCRGRSATLFGHTVHLVDRNVSCMRIRNAYKQHGILSLLSPALYQKEGPFFQKYAEEHSTGQWLAQNALNNFHNASYLIKFLKDLHTMLQYEHPSSFSYISESILHGAVYHVAIIDITRQHACAPNRVWGLAAELCGPYKYDVPPHIQRTHGECLHGIGHGAFYSALFCKQILPRFEYGACSGFPSDLPLPMRLKIANSACDGSPTELGLHQCLRGAYHASSLLGEWGLTRILQAFANGANMTLLQKMFFSSIALHSSLCDRFALYRNACREELSDLFLSVDITHTHDRRVSA